MSDVRPIVSVVMANYNGERHLDAAIRSVLAQTLSALELIVVDDRSADASAEIVARWAKADPRVSLIVQSTNQGPGAARNRALDVVRGDWVAIVDSDDELHPERLSRLVTRAGEDGAAIVADNQTVFTDSGAFAPHALLAGERFDRPQWIDAADFVRAGVMYGRGPDFGFLKPLISTELLGALRYDERLRIGEDYDLLLRLLMRAGRLRLEPAELYLYRKHPQSISHRLKPEHLVEMLEAQDRFRRQAGRIRPDLGAALDQRARSLRTALAYERIVVGLKAGAVGASLATAMAHPPVWPLLLEPVRVRLRRLASADRQRAAAEA